ncbi:MAG: recombinase family protein [Pseudolabrys sp.]
MIRWSAGVKRIWGCCVASVVSVASSTAICSGLSDHRRRAHPLSHGDQVTRDHLRRIDPGRNAVEAVTTEPDRFAANVLPIIREAQKAGATSLRAIAAALNARGVATARGGRWHAKSVANILERASPS